MNSRLAIAKMNKLGKQKSPFFFIIDYEMKNCYVDSPCNAAKEGIMFNFEGKNNYPQSYDHVKKLTITKEPVSLSEYQKAFDLVLKHLKRGNSYLVNLTFPTPIKSESSLKEIFHCTSAKYRLFYKDQFVVFSPETFVKINSQQIYTYPMKGTIDADKQNAESILISNKKELAEHATIVDLLRNDLSRIANKVSVEKFRYIDKIKTSNKKLLQVSSEIKGKLPVNYTCLLGNIIFEMLPAGSICGAPKHKTLEIIEEAETYKRGYYTGVAGYFDGVSLNSCVLIRYIEKNNGNLTYKSGGGITTQSIALDEYNELIDKIYVPFA